MYVIVSDSLALSRTFVICEDEYSSPLEYQVLVANIHRRQRDARAGLSDDYDVRWPVRGRNHIVIDHAM